jgi:cell division protease FtsH
VAPGSKQSSDSPANQQVTQPFFQKLWKKEEGVSYSTLLRDIDNKKIKQLDLVPARREFELCTTTDAKVSVPIFPNDDRILRAAESSDTPLTVVDGRREQANKISPAPCWWCCLW